MFDRYSIHVFKLLKIDDLKLLFHGLMTNQDTVKRVVYILSNRLLPDRTYRKSADFWPWHTFKLYNI